MLKYEEPALTKTKIVATVGPASDDRDSLRKLILAGVDVFRLNFAHGQHETLVDVIGSIRNLAEELQTPVAILGDLAGPKIRLGQLPKEGIDLRQGERFSFVKELAEYQEKTLTTTYPGFVDDLAEGNRVLLADGVVSMKVVEKQADRIICEVEQPGRLFSRQGVNLPGSKLQLASLTEKDLLDLAFALKHQLDFISLSFVRTAKDVRELRQRIQDAEPGYRPMIVSKIEKPEAVDDLKNILAETDVVMVARGDLGVELLPEQVPVAQSQLIDIAKSKFKPVIVATQMLESMINNARPTRAEVTDIAHAVTLGTDAVMLSAETAAGNFPVEAVEMMDRIARQTESYLWKTGAYGDDKRNIDSSSNTVWNVIANATSNMSKQLSAHAVLVISQSGVSAATMSSARPAAPILAITSSPDVCRKISLLWGVIPVLDEETGSINPNDLARRVAKEQGLADTGDFVLLIRGFHSDPDLNTPTITTICV